MATLYSQTWLFRYLTLSFICHNKLIIEVTDHEQKDAVYEWLQRNNSNYLCIEQKWPDNLKTNKSTENHRVLTIYFARRKNAVSFQMSFKGNVNILYERFPFKRSKDV